MPRPPLTHAHLVELRRQLESVDARDVRIVEVVDDGSPTRIARLGPYITMMSDEVPDTRGEADRLADVAVPEEANRGMVMADRVMNETRALFNELDARRVAQAPEVSSEPDEEGYVPKFARKGKA